MSIKLGDNIEMTGPVPNDSRYLNVNIPWTSISEVNSALLGGVGGVRYTGLTVNINGSEYWYENGIGDLDLIKKIVTYPIFTGYTATTQTLYNDTQDPTGFIDNSNIVVTYNKTTGTINLSNPSGINYYYNGVKHTLGTSWTSSGHTINSSPWFLYSSNGLDFKWSNSVWTFSEVQVAAVPANTSWALREVHGIMPVSAHAEFHQNFGTYRRTGFGLTTGTYALQPVSPTDADNTPGFEAGIIKDEDIETSLLAWTQGSYTRMYFTGASTYIITTGQTAIFRVGTTYPKYNPYNGSTFSEVEMSNNNYANWYVIRIPVTADVSSQLYRAVIIQPQFVYTSLVSAEAESPLNLYLGDLSSLLAEYVLVEKITLRTSSSYNGAIGRVRIEATTILSGTRFSQTSTTIGSGTVTAGNVSVVPVSPFTSINLQGLSDEYASCISGIKANYITGATNGLSVTGAKIKLGGSLTGNTTINAATYTLSICGGKLNTDSGYQISGTTILKTTDINSISLGNNAGFQNTGTYQTALGSQAGNNNSGNFQIAIGTYAGCCNISDYQITTGYYAGYHNSGSTQIAIGYCAGSNNLGGCQTALGYNAGLNNTGTFQTVIGYQTGYGNTGANQAAFGCQAGYGNTGISQIVAGVAAGYQNIANCQVAIGQAAGFRNSGLTSIQIGANAGSYNLCTTQIAIGNFAGEKNRNSYQVAIGHFAGRCNSGSTSVQIGCAAGCCNSEQSQIAIGREAGMKNTGFMQIALGYLAGDTNTGGCQIAIGPNAGYRNTGSNQTVLGLDAGYCNVGCYQVAIGAQAGRFNTGNYQNAVGCGAGCGNTGICQIAVGIYAGAANTGTNQIALGYFAGRDNIASCQIAIGCNAGYQNSGATSTAIGSNAGYRNLCIGQIAVGECAGHSNKGPYQTAMGFNAGILNSNSSQIAIGYQTGYDNSGLQQIAIGSGAGCNNTASYQVAIGSSAGILNIGNCLTAIGVQAGYLNSGTTSVMIGKVAGRQNSGDNIVAIGLCAACGNSGDNLIAIGEKAGLGNTENNKFILKQNNVNTKSLICGEFDTRNVSIYSMTLDSLSGATSSAIGVDTSGNIIKIASGSTVTETITGVTSPLSINNKNVYIDFCDNVYLGAGAFTSNTTGTLNIAMGINPLYYNTVGNSNIAFGFNSLYNNTSGNSNIAIGLTTLCLNTTGCNNTAIGTSSLIKNTVGKWNIGLGVNSLCSNTSGCTNIGIGNSALSSNISGCNNIGIGNQALAGVVSGEFNIGIGVNALLESDGMMNTGIGFQSLYNNTIGYQNTGLGSFAGAANITGCSNIFIGSEAGSYELGSYKLYIDNQGRTDEAGGRACSLIYGEFHATPASQLLRINSQLELPYVPSAITSTVLYYNPTTDRVSYGQVSGGTSSSSSLSEFTITGNSSATGFTVNHAKNKQFVGVEVVENFSPYSTVYTNTYRTNTNCICVTFDVAPTTGQQYKILIIG